MYRCVVYYIGISSYRNTCTIRTVSAVVCTISTWADGKWERQLNDTVYYVYAILPSLMYVTDWKLIGDSRIYVCEYKLLPSLKTEANTSPHCHIYTHIHSSRMRAYTRLCVVCCELYPSTSKCKVVMRKKKPHTHIFLHECVEQFLFSRISSVQQFWRFCWHLISYNTVRMKQRPKQDESTEKRARKIAIPIA